MKQEHTLSYAGVWVTPEPVNREKILNEIHQALEGSGTRIFYLTGDGGIGKTYLLREVLKRVGPGGIWHRSDLLAMSDVVDFYHTVTHTPAGLVQALREALVGAPSDAFARYDETYNRFQRNKYDLAGEHSLLNDLQKLQNQMLDAFVGDLNTLSKGSRLVLALDTTERLLYGSDPIHQRLGLEEERVEVLRWLLEGLLGQVQNAVVLLAGRPSDHLEKDLRVLGDRLRPHRLCQFSLDDTRAYFEAVARTAQEEAERARESRMEDEANWLEGFAKQVRSIPAPIIETIWNYTEGKPIALALMVDYLSTSEKLHTRVLERPEALRDRTAEEVQQARREVEADLVRFWQEFGREADPVIEALAWARKGLDAGLLARIAGISEEEAGQLLEKVRGLAFVKIRPGDNRFFLHDGMYELLDRHLLGGRAARREQVYAAILEEYADRILKQRKRVQELWTPREAGRPAWDETYPGMPRPPDRPHELAAATDLLYNLMAEEVYYRLRKEPREGFRAYQLYAKEAFWTTEEMLEHLLRSEMLLFLKDQDERAEKEGKEKKRSFDGLPRAAIEGDMALRRLERYNRSSDPRAIDLARRMQVECADLLKEAGPLARMRLDILEAAARSNQRTDLVKVRAHLKRVIASLRRFGPADDWERWQRSTLLGEAYNLLGYIDRTLGHFARAVEAYGQAVDLWRALEDEEGDVLRRMALRAQHANTLNNRAWALAEMGRFEAARLECEDALEMRRALGPAAACAFSENTLGLILTRDDKPHRARVHCQRALAIFRDLGILRGIGLADIALAEALRRISAIPQLHAPEEYADLLRRAAERADEALDIFQGPIREAPRQVEALIERGCIYRQWAWLRPQYESPDDPSREELAQKSETDLRQAMELAGESLSYRRLDAHVNLAWLFYYIRDNERADREAEKAIAEIPDQYHFSARGYPKRRLPHTFYWPLLGKAWLLRGQITMRQFNEGKDPEKLFQVGEFYTIALAYDELFATDFRDLRRAIWAVHQRLRGLNREEFSYVHQGIANAVQTYRLKEPTRLDQVLREYNLPRRKT